MPKENSRRYAEKMINHIDENKNQPLILSDECEGSLVGDEIMNIQNSMKIITEKEREHFGWNDKKQLEYFSESLL